MLCQESRATTLPQRDTANQDSCLCKRSLARLHGMSIRTLGLCLQTILMLVCLDTSDANWTIEVHMHRLCNAPHVPGPTESHVPHALWHPRKRCWQYPLGYWLSSCTSANRCNLHAVNQWPE